MSDTIDDYKAYKAFNKEIKEKRGIKITEYLKGLENDNLIDVIKEDNFTGHFRIQINVTKIDIWVTTAKFTIVGTNKYQGGFNNIKKLINNLIDKT